MFLVSNLQTDPSIVTFAPILSQSSFVISVSPERGKFSQTFFSGFNKVATMHLVAEFFAPLASIIPLRGLSPVIL